MGGQHQGDGSVTTSDLMAQEGRSIVDTARTRGVVLRLLGGLAVHEYCAGLVVCLRHHVDLDMVAPRRQTRAVVGVFDELGYRERVHVRQVTKGLQAQFARECVHGDGTGRAHAADKVDIFFDSFLLDHRIDLRGRLTQHPYAVSLTDALAAKLQMHEPEPRDLRDAVMLLTVCHGEGTAADELDADYLGALCARDWGLFYDVARNLRRCGEELGGAGLEPGDRARVNGLLARLTGAVEDAPKRLRWRARARIGTRRRWWNTVEEQGEAAS
ncbi:MAG: hypothetical protein GX624_09360 [Actinobacteria bacterium]|nr:hypothetical protein [Actinomycetota bacterium]